MSLEDLLAQEVTSAAKKPQKASDSAAAIYVITQEDIRRSSAHTIPDLLRMVPGIDVADINNSYVSVSARGFTSQFAANMLVMVDGASTFSSSLSGIFWDQALVPLQDIERIEVIRGPGGSLWGSNAVSGIINIITKQSVDTQGVRASIKAGNRQQSAELSFGHQAGDNLSYRIYGNVRRNDGLVDQSGNSLGSDWLGGLAGIRADFAPTPNDTVVTQAELTRGQLHEPEEVIRANLLNPGYDLVVRDNRFATQLGLLRWSHKASDDFDLYFTHSLRTDFGARVERSMGDVSIEAHIRAIPTHDLNIGVSGRIAHDLLTGSPVLSFSQKSNTDRWVTAYIQDDISLVPDRLRLTVGTKVEDNNFTGFEIQPNARLFLRANPRLAAWASISRAVRTPLLLQRNDNYQYGVLMPGEPGNPAPLPLYQVLAGNPQSKAENVLAYELGVRGQISTHWAFDFSAFYNRYDHLMTADLTSITPIFIPNIPFPVGLSGNFTTANNMKGHGKGFEILLKGDVTNWWEAEASWSYLDATETAYPSRAIAVAALIPFDATPAHQLRLRSRFKLSNSFSMNADVHYVGAVAHGVIPAHTDLALRAEYRVTSGMDISLIGNNLLKKATAEVTYFPQNYVPRTVALQLRSRF
ncbi:MAG: TonB-dependent receptor [Sphingomonadales bacterium]|nr:TonB-dependent receptor [Sphingomonadales bacterium]